MTSSVIDSVVFFITSHIWWCIGAGWVVYKLRLVERIGMGEKTGKPRPVGTYASYEEARIKTYKDVVRQYPDANVTIEDRKDYGRKLSGRYFIIEAVWGTLAWTVKFIFVPVKLDDK